MGRGKFIVFEGIDGSGKGTQINISTAYIFKKKKENDLYLTREPTRDFKEIRERMAKADSIADSPEWYSEMFFKDRINHIRRYIKPSLIRGTHVLCDRYKLSTLAYQSLQGMDLFRLIEMHERILVPDLTILFDCSSEVAFERRKKEGATDMFDKDFEFQKRLRKRYLELAEIIDNENIVVVDSTPEPSNIFREVKTHLDKII